MPATITRPRKAAVKAKAPARPLVGQMRTENRTVQLPNGQWVSPRAYFIRTGLDPVTGKRPKTMAEVKGFSTEDATKLGARFLSREWVKGYKQKVEKGKKVTLPLPTQEGRLRGARLSDNELRTIDEQINFAFKIFEQQIPAGKRKEVINTLRNNISRKNLNVNEILNGSNPSENREEGQELHTFLKNEGKMYKAAMDTETGRSHFAQGLLDDPKARTTPIHETVHMLQRSGVIKIDVPFAQAIDRLYGLERGIFKPYAGYNKFEEGEFDRKPSIDRSIPMPEGIINYNEPNWSYVSGNKLGQWVYTHIQPEYRWQYMKDRCNGISHGEAVERVKSAARGRPRHK